MKRVLGGLLGLGMLLGLCACGDRSASIGIIGGADGPTSIIVSGADEPTPTAETVPTEAPVPETPEYTLPAAEEGWREPYLTFLSDNYDIFAALWPSGMSGVGFIDLDLDSVPEMLVFDLGASATLGVQLFDLVEGEVHCVASGHDGVPGAFGDEYFLPVSICANYYDSFRLLKGEDGYMFWVQSSNGTLESAWDEIIRFESADGVLRPVSVCSRYMESNVETGEIVAENYTVSGEDSDAAGYETAAAPFVSGEDTGYTAVGMFLWDNMKHYDTTYDGFMAMAKDAATAYAVLPAA